MKRSLKLMFVVVAMFAASCTPAETTSTGSGPAAPGTDKALDALWVSCSGGDLDDCDELYQVSAVGSDYETHGATCAGRGDGFGDCASVVSAIPQPPGDDKRLDALWVSCADGDADDCETLYQDSKVGSDYEAFGLSCGGRGEGNCADVIASGAGTDGGGEGGDDQVQPDGPNLDVAFTVVTLDYGARKAVEVLATDDGQPTAFETVAGDGSCFNATQEAAAVVINAGVATCAGQISISNGDSTETVQVNVVDPTSMDIGEGLLIRYTNDFVFRWHDGGSGADRDTGMYHPVAPPGYFPVGTMIRQDQTNPTDKAWMIVVSDSRGANTLAPPTDYNLLWHDGGSGSDNDGAVWQPICPAGFNAMGVVSNPSKPSLDDVRCVAERYTAVGEPGSHITDDAGSGGDLDLSVDAIAPPRSLLSGGRTALSTGAVSVNKSTGHYLAVQLPVHEDSARVLDPRLTSCAPIDTQNLLPVSTRATRVPFTMLGGTISTKVDNVDRSPFFVLRRETIWTDMQPQARDNCNGSTGLKVTAKATTGSSNTKTDSFSKEVGVTVTAGGDIGPVSTEVSVSVTLGWSNEESQTYSTESSVTDEKCIPPGRFGQFLHQTTTFRAINAQGGDEGAISIGLATTKYLEWPSGLLGDVERESLC